MDVLAPKAPGRAESTRKQDLAAHPFRAFVTGGAVTGSVSGLASAASYGAGSAPHQCTIQGLPRCTGASFPSAAALLSPLPNQPDNLLHSHLSLVYLPGSREGEGVMQHPIQHCPVAQAELPPPSIEHIAARCQQWIQPGQTPFFSTSLSHSWLGATTGFEGLDVDPAQGYVDGGAQLHLRAIVPPPRVVWPFSDHSGKAGTCPVTRGFGGQLGAHPHSYTHTCQHTDQPHMDISHLLDNGNLCPLQAWLALKMLSGGGQRVLRLQASLVQAQLPHLMKHILLHPRALCDLLPCSYTTVRARAEGLNQRLPTVSHSTDHPVSSVCVTSLTNDL